MESTEVHAEISVNPQDLSMSLENFPEKHRSRYVLKCLLPYKIYKRDSAHQ